MRIRRLGRVAFATACALFMGFPGVPGGTAFANDELSREGYYVAAGGVYGVELLDTSPLSQRLLTPLSTSNGWGLNVRAGNRVRSWLAFELQYEWMQGIDISQPAASIASPGPGTIGTYSPDVITVNAKFLLPIGPAQPYLLVGGGLVSYDLELLGGLNAWSTSSNGFAFRAGGGVDAYLTKRIVFFAEGSLVLNTDITEFPAAPTGQTPIIQDLYYISVSAGFACRF